MNKKISMALESYLEKIAELQAEFGVVNSSVLAERMGCKRSSVTSALRRLAEKGLINYQTYKPVTLTKEGLDTIERLDTFHNVLAQFFTEVLNIQEDFSQQEACRLEHRISKAVVERIALYLEFKRKNENFDFEKSEFKKFIKKNFK